MWTFAMSFLTTGRAKLTAITAALLIACAFSAVTVTRIYRAGYIAGKQEAVVLIANAKLEAAAEQNRMQRKLLDTENAMRALEQQAASLMEKARQAGAIQVRTVERVIRENPNFAAVVRPPELDRVRQQQLTAIADAATRGAHAATELPRAGLPAVRGARTADSDYARADRNH
jgi:hypothetical protein